MKNILMGSMLALAALTGATTASAWGQTRCEATASFAPNSATLAKNCGKYIYGKGIISFGHSKGKVWAEEYKNEKFGGDTMLHPVAHRNTVAKIPKGFEVDLDKLIDRNYSVLLTFSHASGKDSLLTKRISEKDIDGYLKQTKRSEGSKQAIKDMIHAAKKAAWEKDAFKESYREDHIRDKNNLSYSER